MEALIVFIRYPEQGKVKTRLAAKIGQEQALSVYKRLLEHTRNIVSAVKLPVYVYYAEDIAAPDIWPGTDHTKRIQQGKELGERMLNAFSELFVSGYSKLVIIGSDCYELTPDIIIDAFETLNKKDVVIGPAMDGGYYLLGMGRLFGNLFSNKLWSTDKVLAATVADCKEMGLSYRLLQTLRDIDTRADLPAAFLPDLT